MTHDPSTPLLSADAIRIAFADTDDTELEARTVVDGVGFDLHPGRVLALVGESGSGKSVTAMSILGLLPPNARVDGSVLLGDRQLIGAPPRELRAVRGGRIGTIFQEPMNAFDPVYTIEWQIAEALTAHGRTGRAEARERVRDLLRTVGIRDVDRVARAHPHELSGGQLQRAMIAMAISCDPEILIADEPTTALDVTVQAGILALIRSLRDERGVAVLLITHDMGVVADLADDVVVMRAGAVVERADVQTLFAAPRADYTRELLRAVPRLDQGAPDAATAASGSGAVARVTDVDIVYGTSGWGRTVVHAVSGASLAIDAGRTFGLVGESGSGKSTLGRALAGLVPVAAGSVEITGVDLATASHRRLRQVRRGIGYVFQDPASSINPRSTIGRAIAEPLRLHAKLAGPARRAKVGELLDAVQLPASFAARYPHELSGGQRQRVAIARALALRPALLIADEPTSALDVSVQAKVLELFVQLQREFGFACLFISHDLAVVQEVAQDVAVLQAGRVVETGPARRLLTHPAEPYTQRLIAAAPVADPVAQRERRARWRRLTDADAEVIA
ncbi:dipeptide ABC transporter ATP-binding protein [Microbacterium sp.]|uniref:dipeptide ABC transporter ATP-binding protein n=1 Tax=Microbacterium sp. TaxID=51671 RepID=UPI003A8ED317